jgi:hypothetical protein
MRRACQGGLDRLVRVHVNVKPDLVRVNQMLSSGQIRTVLGIVDSSPVASSVAAEKEPGVLEEELLERSSRQICIRSYREEIKERYSMRRIRDKGERDV